MNGNLTAVLRFKRIWKGNTGYKEGLGFHHKGRKTMKHSESYGIELAMRNGTVYDF